jgi:hypothetical protein
MEESTEGGMQLQVGKGGRDSIKIKNEDVESPKNNDGDADSLESKDRDIESPMTKDGKLRLWKASSDIL